MKFLGHDFADEQLLEEALTTPSYRMDHPSATDNQRLEFLGDAVLGFLSADRLFREFPSEKEGPLTVRRTHMVSTAALCAAAERHALADVLRRNRGAAPLPANSKTIADAVEAVIGAAYLDGGISAAEEVFAVLELNAHQTEDALSANPKGELQIAAQAMRPPRHPSYRLVETRGQAHNPVFTVEVAVEGVGNATASAGTHREAEAQAAAKLLVHFKRNQKI